MFLHILRKVLRLTEVNRKLVMTWVTLITHRVDLYLLSWQVTLQIKFNLANCDDIQRKRYNQVTLTEDSLRLINQHVTDDQGRLRSAIAKQPLSV